jgi:hypothetical protein
MSTVFGWEYELEAGMKRQGRPMVWETRKVRGETNQSRFAAFFTFFPHCLLTTKLHHDTRRPQHSPLPHNVDAHYIVDSHAGICYPKPTHLFACMPAQALGDRLESSAMRWLECHLTGSFNPIPVYAPEGNKGGNVQRGVKCSSKDPYYLS